MTPENIKTAVTELNADIDQLKKRLNILKTMLKTYQESICKHRHADGSSAFVQQVGIGYRYDECAICGKKIDMR